jgi:centrosomal protein CEP41
MPVNENEGPKILLLDLRSEQDYKSWHIKNAINFPAINIQRDQVFGQLTQFKNRKDKLIVVYAEDERHGTHLAKIIFEKGFDNVYLLTGGISVFTFENTHLTEGIDVPSKEQLKENHRIATAKQPKPKNMQSSKGFAKSMDLQK